MNDAIVETIRLDSDTKTQLLTLKRRTGIENWNVLCRWALCLSLADESPVRDREERGLGAIEMSWKTFAGEDDEIYRLLLVDRCQRDHGRADRDTLSKVLRQHIARGSARLVSDRSMKSITDFIELANSAVQRQGNAVVEPVSRP
jgi:DNA sulfur modification protein DndE